MIAVIKLIFRTSHISGTVATPINNYDFDVLNTRVQVEEAVHVARLFTAFINACQAKYSSSVWSWPCPLWCHGYVHGHWCSSLTMLIGCANKTVSTLLFWRVYINKYVEFSDIGYIITMFALKRRDNGVNRGCDSYIKATLVLLNSKFGGRQ